MMVIVFIFKMRRIHLILTRNKQMKYKGCIRGMKMRTFAATREGTALFYSLQYLPNLKLVV